MKTIEVENWPVYSKGEGTHREACYGHSNKCDRCRSKFKCWTDSPVSYHDWFKINYRD